MKKILLTLATAFIASFAMAEEYPVVTSVDELYALEEGTMVEFQNLEVVVVPNEWGADYYLSDSTTVIGGNVYPIPACFTAVGSLITNTNWQGDTYKQFNVETVFSVSKFNTLAELLNFGTSGDNVAALSASESITAAEGDVVVTAVVDDYIFYYTVMSTGYYNQYMYGVMTYPAASEQFFVGQSLVAVGGFTGQFTPAIPVYNDEYELISYTGSCFAIGEDVIMYADQWDMPITYNPTQLTDLEEGYLSEAMTVRIPYGGTFTSVDGKYFYTATVTTESYDYETGNWVTAEKEIAIEVFSAEYNLEDYVGTVCEDFVAGVWDKKNMGDSQRLIITKFIPTVASYANIRQFLNKGEQYEEEIITEFQEPLMVTYTYDDAKWKFVITAQDETGAILLDFSDAIEVDEEGNPSQAYASLQAIKPGDYITGVKGYPQFYASNVSPRIICAAYDYNTEETKVFLPTPSGEVGAVKAVKTITVGDMLDEWDACKANSTIPTIANNVVRLLDVQVVTALNQWNEEVLYLVQGTDSMELSNLWGADKMNFQVFERNNIVGIADFSAINSNYIYQFQPLGQEYITDATLITEVYEVSELEENEGNIVIFRNATITSVAEGWETFYYLNDEVSINGITSQGVFDLQGIYENGTFTVLDVVSVRCFNAISDMDAFITKFPEFELEPTEVLSPVMITHVVDDLAFIQYQGLDNWGSVVTVGSVIKGISGVERGDIITGLKGVSAPKIAEMDTETWNLVMYQGASFTLAEDAEIKIESSDNEVAYGRSEGVAYMESNCSNYSGTAMKLLAQGGKVVAEGDKYFYAEMGTKYNPATYEQEPFEYRMEIVSTEVDLSKYLEVESVEVMWPGVFDYMNSSPEASRFFIHSEISTTAEFESIADLFVNGNPEEYNISSLLVNPVTVTYCYNGGEWGPYYIFVQDETAAIRYDVNDAATLDNVKVGDQIKDLKGTFGLSWMGLYTMKAPEVKGEASEGGMTFNVVGNVAAEPMDVTIAQLMEEGAPLMEIAANYGDIEEPASLYASRLVRISKVSIVEEEVDGQVTKYLQDKKGSRMKVPADFAEGYTTYQEMNITGIVDWGCSFDYSYLYKIYPRSQDDITDCTGLDAVEANGNIYMANNVIVAAGAVEVVVYDVNGRTVAVAAADTVDANALAQGVYVVRATYADGTAAVAKVVR